VIGGEEKAKFGGWHCLADLEANRYQADYLNRSLVQ
jgi:hypothetical protein